MTPDEDPGLLAAARAISAGQRVDWAAIESSVKISESFAIVLRELKVIADIAELHRSLSQADTPPFSHLDLVAPLSASATSPATLEAVAWGSLKLLERVGEGAFGEVYRAWDPRLDREVALKLLRRLESRRDSVGSHVIDEGRLLARVRHPNVVTVYGADRFDGRLGLWMEFVRGRTLEVVLHDRGPFGAQEATLIGLDLCRALSAVHGAGLIHRDIKAQNVMREAGGRIVLMDFGTGRDDLATMPVELAGTPLYLAPEVFSGQAATARSDIYSVGVLLFHLVTGSYPVKGRTVTDLREAHGQRRRSWLRDVRPDLTDNFVQVVERALTFDSVERYETAGAMEAALASVMLSTDVTPSKSASETTGATRNVEVTRLRSIGRPARIASAGLAVAVAIAIVIAPATWRDKIFGRHGSPLGRGGQGLGAAASSSVVVRRVSLPDDYFLIGRPSVDGNLFSLVDGTGNIGVIDLMTGQFRRMTNDAVLGKDSQNAEHSTISADSRFVAYTWFALDGKYELRVADIDGQRPRVLLRSETIDYPWPVEWSRDGASILSVLTRPDYSNVLASISIADGAVHAVKELGPVRPEHASLSPDGEFVVYDYPQQPAATARDIFIVRSDGSDERRLIEFPATDVDPVWTPDGRHVLFASDRSGTMDLWTVAVTGGRVQGEPHVIHRNIGRTWLRGLTDTGSYYYYSTVGAVDVYDAKLSNNAVTNPVALPTSYSGSNISSIWSPDGRRLAYASRRGLVARVRGSTTLAVRDLQTNEQRELVPALNSFLVRAWSPDGRRILVSGQDAQGRQGPYQIDIETGRGAPLLTHRRASDPPDVRRPDWISDGRVLYFSPVRKALLARDVQSGAEQVVIDLHKEDINVIGDVYGRGYRLSPDGHTLAYTSAVRDGDTNARSIGIKVLEGGPSHELARVTAPELILFQDWTPDGTALLFTRWTAQPRQLPSPPSLWRVSIHGGEPQSLGFAMEGLRDVSVHPDGSRITFTAGWPKNELWVIEHLLDEQ